MKTGIIVMNAFLAILPLFAVQAFASLVVTDPAGVDTAIVDPVGAETVDGTVGPFFNVTSWNEQAKKYTISFDQAEFTAGSQLSQVVLTSINQTITFSATGQSGQGIAVGNTVKYATSGEQQLVPILTEADGDRFVISFSKPVEAVAFTTMIDWGSVLVYYYDDNHNQLYAPSQGSSGGDTTTNATWMDYFFSYSNSDAIIASIEIERTNVNGWPAMLGIDDLSFAVPEPATVSLLLVGGVAAMIRRKN